MSTCVEHPVLNMCKRCRALEVWHRPILRSFAVAGPHLRNNLTARLRDSEPWAPTGMGKGHLPPPWKCWKVLFCCKVDEVFMHHFEKMSYPTGELPLNPAGGRPSFRPPHCPPLENILRAPMFRTYPLSQLHAEDENLFGWGPRRSLVTFFWQIWFNTVRQRLAYTSTLCGHCE